MTYVSILYPNASAARLILKFFHTLRSFPWPQPLYLCEIKRARGKGDPLGLQIWDKWRHVENILNRDSRTEPMPIITPVYPYTNSTWAINLTTKEILINEFFAAEETCKRILSLHYMLQTQWHHLLVPYPLFDIFENFLLIDLSASQSNTLFKWSGFLLSKLRLLTNEIQPFAKVRLWPKAFDRYITEDKLKLTYFLGVSVRRKLIHLASFTSSRKKGLKKINLREPIERFKELINRSTIKNDNVEFQMKKLEKSQIFCKIKDFEENSLVISNLYRPVSKHHKIEPYISVFDLCKYSKHKIQKNREEHDDVVIDLRSNKEKMATLKDKTIKKRHVSRSSRAGL